MITAIKKGGEVVNLNDALEQIKSKLDRSLNGEYMIRIEKRVKKRSIDQNAWLWACFKCISENTGTDAQTIHDYYCTMFLTKHITVNGKDSIVVRGTSKLSTTEFALFMDKMIADVAIEFGIRLPHPDDKYYQNFIDQYG